MNRWDRSENQSTAGNPASTMDHVAPQDYDGHVSEVLSGDDEIEPKLEDPGSPSASSAAGKPRSLKNAQLQKRRRVTRACDECRRKKIKCDGKQPCTHCTVYSYDCTYDQPSNRRRNPAPQYVENLEHRVHRAETLLHILIPNLDLTDPGIDVAVAQGFIPGAPGRGTAAAANATTRQQGAQMPTVADQKSDTNLESMVRAVAQMDIDEQGNWDYHGHSSGLSFVRRMREQLGDIMGPEPTASTPFVRLNESPRSAIDSPLGDPIPYSPGNDLPPKELARRLCANAVDDATSLLRFLHKPTFWQGFDRLYNEHMDNWSNEEHRFLPLMYSAMALGSLFGKTERSNNSGGYESAIQRGFSYFRSARQLMDIADCRDIPSLQAVIFMILFMQSSAKLSQCYAYVGVALRSALRMGLHRSYAGTFDPIELETRKRVFWCVRKMDVYVGALLGLPQTLSDEDIDQDMPAEYDDEYITRTGYLPMPEGLVSMTTAFNAHTRIVLLLQKIVRKVYPIKIENRGGQADKSYVVPFSVIREIESDLERWQNSLPAVLKPCEAPERYERVQQLLRLAYAFAQVLLYRPFLHFTATDKRLKPVDQRAYACAASYVNVARNIIHITSQMKQKGLLNGAYWFVMYTTFFSILSLVYFAAENPDNPTTTAVMKDALEGKETLASLVSHAMAADRCTMTLDAIFSRLPDWMREGKPNPANPILSKKRSHGPPPGTAGSKHDPSSNYSQEPPGPGFNRRASTFPRHEGMTRVSELNSHVASPWEEPSGAGPFGAQLPTINNQFDSRGWDYNNMPTSASSSGVQDMPLPPNFANPAIPDVSAMMFPSGNDEPFIYPNQPLTAFENAQQTIRNSQYLNSLTNGNPDIANSVGTPHSQHSQMSQGTTRTKDDNMEAQFFALPPYLEQAQQQQRRQQQQQQQQYHPSTSFGQSSGQAFRGMQLPSGMHQMANGWPSTPQQQQGQQGAYGSAQQNAGQDYNNINIQDLFGGAEWNAMIMDPGFRPQ